MKDLRSRLSIKRFLRQSAGNVGMMMALSALPLLLGAGAAIDFVRYNDARTHLQSALDAGALAGASVGAGVTDAERIAAAEKMFLANMQYGSASSLTYEQTFEVEDGVLRGSARADVPMSFMVLAGIDKLEANGLSEVGIATGKKAEIVLVLDYSGSMYEVLGGQVKYQAMRNAAKKLVEDLAGTSGDKVKFGLVPFSHFVRGTLPGSHVLGAPTGSNWTGCTQDRRYPFNTTANTPTTASASKWGQPQAPEHVAWGCSGMTNNKLTMVDLSDQFQNITQQLDEMTPYAWTHIALGVEFGYHMLSPNAPFVNGASFSDDKVEKFMVVLTDGMQTEPGFGPGSVRNVAQAESNLEVLCENAKGDGITMITVAYDLNDTSTRKRLRDCSTDPDKHFFIADDSNDLAKAFDTVKQAITAEVYLSK